MSNIADFVIVIGVVSAFFVVLAALSDFSLRIEDAWHVAKRRRIYRRMRRSTATVVRPHRECGGAR